MLICYCVSILLLLIYFAAVAVENMRRDKKYGKPAEFHDVTEGFADVTDKNQEEFRYTH